MNKIPFQIIYQNHSRNIVVHHTHILNDLILQHLGKNDIVFFDDCVYSQYFFIKNNIDFFNKNNIKIVLSLSTDLIRTTYKPFLEKTNILHDAYHRNDMNSKNGFMTFNEIVELLEYPNIYLACHGHKHLELDDSFESTSIFKKDLDDSVDFLKQHELQTNIFIYPYDHIIRFSESILKKNGFNFIFPSKDHHRIYIEELIDASN